ncbi:HAMP domain-containing methyl-accepting chemotaxis protein [Anaerocolumna sp. AGMB13025]|uniref:methyl-accepting chemotaxis protein n=1 Tax=Anaerocolumna sp. AGMB13025 TaxID=3039116 RepID=UPI00241C8118|nr:HAMP domain-containing methyl-accepting chemotaxis protein [Anaerocolumna sp. AGMB13025]WFR56568.1 HAMP domain-containing methyl-accepting chemotaxis protein [Anaerocolumna sp. AGMB13025]
MLKGFKNFKIATKLILSFILVALIAGVVGAVGLVNIISINNADSQLYDDNTQGIRIIADADVSFQRLRINLLKILTDSNNTETYKEKIQTYSDTMNSMITSYEETISQAEDRKLYEQLSKDKEGFDNALKEVMSAVEASQMDEAKSIILGDAQTTADTLQTSFDNLFQYNSDAAADKSKSNDQLASSSIITMIIIIIAGVFLAIVLGLIISRMISKPINIMVTAADKLALGDVNANVEVYSKDETGSLADSFRRMITNIRTQAITAEKIAGGDLTVDVSINSDNDLLGKKLHEMVEKNNEVLSSIAVASDLVAAGAKQMSDASIALSQGATEQASSVEELTSSLEEISVQTKINAENANKANELAEIAKNNAMDGNSQMKEMQKAMEEINISSENISKIIKVIDEIAFQTNILALNAAVEAARAGQHGKGFAVVAEEVRNLAARSANAAKETTDMIEGSIRKVEVGTKFANETAQALNRIVEDVSKATSLVSDIAIASNEQAAAIEQVNQGIMQVSQVIQTNSATSEESAAASEELAGQAEVLKESVSKFSLKKNYANTRQYDELNPEVIQMLEKRFSQKKSSQVNGEKEKVNSGNNARIVLSDSEFGKY